MAGVLLVAGSVLDWSGIGYSSTLDRRLSFAAGVVLVGVSAAALWWRACLAVAIPAGALGLNMGVVNYRDISGKLYEYVNHAHAAVGTGRYLVIAGGALGLLVGIGSVVPRVRASAAAINGERDADGNEWLVRLHAELQEVAVAGECRCYGSRADGRGFALRCVEAPARVGCKNPIG